MRKKSQTAKSDVQKESEERDRTSSMLWK